MSKLNILVVGGAGFIGSHVTKMLDQNNFYPIVFDNLSTGDRKAVTCGTFVKGDLANSEDLDLVFTTYPIAAVMHFAAIINVGESIHDPLKYYTHNVSYTLNLLTAMQKHRVKNIIFSSSAAIFGLPEEIPLRETHPCRPISPYGQTKLQVENILKNCDEAYGIKFCSLRYFNAAGGDPEGKIKNYKQTESNLIPLVLRSLKNPFNPITIYGTDYPVNDGTCVRDYIHLEDLGAAHILALKQLLKNQVSVSYNLGNGQGFSVRQVISAVEKTVGLKVNAIEGPRRIGDPPILVADAYKARLELGWEPVYPNIEEMIAHAWQALDP